MYHLICVQPFGTFKKGDRVTDADQVAQLLASRDKHFVKVPAPVSAPVVAAQAAAVSSPGFDE